MTPPHLHIEAAIRSARQSPCRSKRGVAIFRDGTRISTGYNHKPAGFHCDGSAACKATCRVEAVHAEQMAIIAAGRTLTNHADLLHVKVDDTGVVPSGGPSCAQCSKFILEAGIAGVWLCHEDGWRRYGAVEFHQLALEAALQPSKEEK